MKKLLLAVTFAATTLAAHAADPIQALMVTGGCCHDYPNQKEIISKGVSERANVEWTVVHEGGSKRDHKVSIYNDPDWADGFDVVVHNECYGAVKDPEFVAKIVAAHERGVPSVVLHCSMHSYRSAKNADAWRRVLGVTSKSHEGHRSVDVKNLKPDHPVMKGFPKVWKTPNGELYKIEKVWPGCVPLAQAYGKDTKKDHACIWVNEQDKIRTFGTTIGHHNVTMNDPVWLDVVTRGLLWSVKKLDKSGKPAKGYEAEKK